MLNICSKKDQEWTRQTGQGDLLGNIQETEMCPYEQLV